MPFGQILSDMHWNL